MGEIIKFIDSATPLPIYNGDKKISLVTGCFDLIHSGHINLFRFAKNHSDILIVGLDADEAISNSKGNGRPILTQNERAILLSELISVDYVIKLNFVGNFKSLEAEEYYDNLALILKPTFIVSSSIADYFIASKTRRAQKIGAKLLTYDDREDNSTTNIVNKILNQKSNEG